MNKTIKLIEEWADEKDVNHFCQCKRQCLHSHRVITDLQAYLKELTNRP